MLTATKHAAKLTLNRELRDIKAAQIGIFHWNVLSKWYIENSIPGYPLHLAKSP